MLQGLFRRLAQGDDGGTVFGACAAAPFLMPAPQQRTKARAAAQIQHADTLWRVQLVARDGKHVDFGVLQVDGNLAHRLHGIGVEQHTFGMCHFGHFLHGKNRPRFIVGPHDGDHGHPIAQQRRVFVQVQTALVVDAQAMDGIAFLLQLLAQGKHRRVFHHGGDDLAALGLGLEGGQDGGVVRLGAAGGEDDLRVVGRAEQRLHLATRVLHRLAHLRAEAVDGRRIAEVFREKRQHGLDHGGIDPCGGVVVQVDVAHDQALFSICTAGTTRTNSPRASMIFCWMPPRVMEAIWQFMQAPVMFT